MLKFSQIADQFPGFYLKKDCFLSGQQLIEQSQLLYINLKCIRFEKVIISVQNLADFTICFMASIFCGKKVLILSNPSQIHRMSLNEILFLNDQNWKNYLSNKKVIKLDMGISGDEEICFFTSGSSGEPKETVKKMEQLLLEAYELKNLFPLADSQFICSTVSHLHIYGFLFRLLCPLVQNCKIDNKLYSYHEDLLDLKKEGEHVLVTSPAFLKRLDLNINVESHFKYIFSSGGLLPYEISKQAMEIFNEWPIEIFGSTETGGIAWRKSIQPQMPWKAFPSVNWKVNQSGQLYVASPFTGRESIQVGDIVERVDDDHFILRGRFDRIVKIEEKRLSLLEMEQMLLSHPQVKDCAVLALQIGGRQQTACILCLEEDLRKKIKVNKNQVNLEFRSYLSERFERVLLPKRFRYLESIPVNHQGKQIRVELEKLFL